ncbi:MAG: metallopeptidase TldD-related protein [Kofleriaceae bacterium]
MTAAADAARLEAALRRQPALADWTARSRSTETAWRRVDGAGAEADGTLARTDLAVEVHRDLPTGRGSAIAVITTDEPAVALAQAARRAAAAVGPSWVSPAPAAPAEVDLTDPAILGAPLAEVADEVMARARAAVGRRGGVGVDVAVSTTATELFTRRGQRARWQTTAVEVEFTVEDRGRRTTLRRRARQLSELDLPGALAGGLPDAAAVPLPAGTYPLVMTAAALLHDDRGLLEAFVGQADPRLERQGLVRYRRGQLIAPGATLSLTSDGTLPFGWWSAPLGEHGEAVRRFPLVQAGVAAGLGLDPREAALRGSSPNGDVRGLVVDLGADQPDALIGPGVLVVERLAWLEVERTSGWFRAQLAAGTLHAAAGARPVTGGIVRGDAIAALATARRSATAAATPSYRGPSHWLLAALPVD